MKLINDAVKSWTDLQIKALEKYKYTVEGPNRSPGSYFLTFMKSSLTAAEKDPEMYNVKLGMDLGLIAVIAGTSLAAGYVIGKKKKNNDISIDEKESN